MKKGKRLEGILKGNPNVDEKLFRLARKALEEVRGAQPEREEAAPDIDGDSCDHVPAERDRRAVIIRTSL